MFDAATVKNRCNGMLPRHVYQKIYDTALRNSGGSFIEVGAAHAAATVCLASALRDSMRDGKVYSFEKIMGGSRERFGDFATNQRIIEDNLSHFGVRDRVEMTFGDVRECAGKVPPGDGYGLMMLDADGRIDRDFGLFFNMLRPGADVIIDDVADYVRAKRKSGVAPIQIFRIDQKHRISALLVDLFERKQFIRGGKTNQTWFGTKVGGRFDATILPDVLDCYHNLVFADARYNMLSGGVTGKAMNKMRRILPASTWARLRRLVSPRQSA